MRSERVVAVDGGVHVVSLEPQGAFDRFADVRVVLDDQHAPFSRPADMRLSLARRSKKRPRAGLPGSQLVHAAVGGIRVTRSSIP